MLNEFIDSMIADLSRGWFSYTKKNGRDIAPCGMARRCKSHHRKCSEYVNGCGYKRDCRLKALLRLIYEARKKKEKPKRKRALLIVYEQEYRKKAALEKAYYQREYQYKFWRACQDLETLEKYRVEGKGKKIEAFGLAFYTTSDDRYPDNMEITEARTGLYCGTYGKLKDHIAKAKELLPQYPDVMSLSEK